MKDRRLTKSSTDKMIAGVCGGLARQLDIDSTWVRLIFVLLIFAGGAGVLIYLGMTIVMPSDANARPVMTTPPTQEMYTPAPPPEPLERRRRNGEIAGLVLIVVGIIFLGGNFHLFSWWRWDIFWPLALIVSGALLLIRRASR